MIGVVAAAGAAAAAWVAVPFVDMAVRRTIDQRTVAGWRTVAPAVAAAPVVPIPTPRAPVEVLRPAGGHTRRSLTA